MSITHSKVSDKSDDADTTLVRPSDWNAAHTGEIPGADVPATHAGSAHHTVESGQSTTHTHAGHDTAHAHSATTGITATDHHSNTNDHVQSHDHSAAGDGSTLTPAVLNVPTAAAPTPTAEGQAYWDSDDDKLVVGDGAGQKIIVPTTSVSGDATMSTAGAVTVAGTHAGTAHHAAYSHPNHSGEVTSVADGAQTVAATHSGSAHHAVESGESSTHTHAGGSGAVTRAGGNTVEATTTSTSDVALLSIASLSIGASVPLYSIVKVRKTTGAAADAKVGLTVNATAVRAAIAWAGASNEAMAGIVVVFVSTASTSYTAGGMGMSLSAGGTQQVLLNLANNAAWPVATLTDWKITAAVNNASVTMGADELHLYSYSVN